MSNSGDWGWTFTENEYKNQMNFYRYFDGEKYDEMMKRLNSDENPFVVKSQYRYSEVNLPSCLLRTKG